MEPAALIRPRFWLPVAAGIGVAVVLGVYGRLHEPMVTADVQGFLRVQTVKVWLATAVGVLLLVQLLTALGVHGVLPGGARVSGVHRWSGRITLLLSVPVAVHCLYTFGLRSDTPRVLAHSLFGCLLYGVFVTKMLLLSRPGASRWGVPLAGGALLVTVAVLWATSALWFFTTIGTTW